MNQITPTTTAEQRYAEHKEAILNLLDQLACKVAAHNRQFAKSGRRDWGYPGDLAHIRELLQEAADFLNTNQE